MICPPPESPASAFVSLVDHRYGFSFVDIGITSADLSDFDELLIYRDQDYNQFGNISKWEDEIACFLSEIGPNESHVIEKVAKKINQIATQILTLSGRETAWISLRATTPNTKFEMPRWHMDGNHYYPSDKSTLQYKFALTFIGPSTLFYPIPKECTELRRIIWMHMSNRKFMDELCDGNNGISPLRGQGVLFLAGNQNKAAIHSDPPLHEPRLFFSIVPCKEAEIETVRHKIIGFYK